MNEERMECESARYTCVMCGGAVIEGVLTPESEAICRRCLDNISMEELLELCDAADTAELLTALGFFAF